MTLVAAVLIGATAFSPSQIQPKQTGGKGSISIGNYRVVNRSYLNYTFDLLRKGESDISFEEDLCRRSCNGKKHLAHRQCDATCDSICKTLHEKTIKGNVGRIYSGIQKLIASLTTAYPKMGLRTDTILPRIKGGRPRPRNDGNRMTTEALEQMGWESVYRLNDGGKKYWWEYKAGHWNQDPCSTKRRRFKYWRYDIVIKWQIVRLVVKPGGGHDTILGPKGQQLIGTLKVPQKKTFDGKKTIECKCSFTDERYGYNDSGLYIPGSSGTPGSPISQPGGIYVDQSGDGEYQFAGGDLLDSVGFSVSCLDLNEYSISVTSKQFGIRAFPGLEFVPEDDSYQRMVSVSQALIAGLSASVRPVPDLYALGRASCLDINKKEPNGNVRYDWRLPQDTKLGALAEYTAGRRFQGPWDQARMWIYTDAATFDEINKRIFPNVSAARYVVAVHVINQVTGFEFADRRYEGCFEPALLADAHNFPESAAWYAGELVTRKPRDLERWIDQRSLLSFGKMLTDGQPEWATEYAAALANTLCAADDSRVRTAALEALARLDRAMLARLATADGLTMAFLALTSDDRETVEKALVLAEAASHPSAYGWLMDLDESMPESLRERALLLADKLSEG